MSTERILGELDIPRQMPSALRGRIEEALLDPDRERGPEDPGLPALPAALDSPRPLPSELRGRLEAALAVREAQRVTGPLPRAVLAAATAVAVIASFVVVSRSETSDPLRTPAPLAQSISTPRTDGPDPETADSTTDGSQPSTSRSSLVLRAPHTGAPAPADHPPPPFAFRGRSPRLVVPATGTPLRVAAIAGDGRQEAAFRGYMDLLNRTGGVQGRPVEVVDSSSQSPASGALVTVNLSGVAVAGRDGPPSWVRGPLVEGPSATEDVLRGSVYGFASPPERQAHLLADAVFPDRTPSAVAAIYRGQSGVFAQEIPRALREVLEARAVRVVEVVYDGRSNTPLIPADAVFLSLDRESTHTFLEYARGYGYQAPRSVSCIFPMLDMESAPRLEDGYLVLAPYSLGDAEETRELERLSGRQLSTSTIHGWVAAKSVAVAIWRSGATGPEAMGRALGGLAGYDTRFAPPLQFRAGTNSRTPEGILYEVKRGSFVVKTPFRSDPF